MVARWAHNPKVVGSNPTPATTNPDAKAYGIFLFPPRPKACFVAEKEIEKPLASEASQGFGVMPPNKWISGANPANAMSRKRS